MKPDAAISVARPLLTDFHVKVLTFLSSSSRRHLLSIDSAVGAVSSCPGRIRHSRFSGLMPTASTQPASRRTSHHGDYLVHVQVQGLRISEPGGRCFLLLRHMINSGFQSLLMMHTAECLPCWIASSSSGEPHFSGTLSLCLLMRISQPVRRKGAKTGVALSYWANCTTSLTIFVTNSVCMVNVVLIVFIAVFPAFEHHTDPVRVPTGGQTEASARPTYHRNIL